MTEIFPEKRFLLKQLIKRDLTSKYKDSVLGIAWSFLNPLMIMIVFTAIFSMMFGRQIENYPVYFLSGRVIYDLFKSGTIGAMKSVKANSSILKKVYVPRYMFAVSKVCYEFINFLISLIILAGVMIVTSFLAVIPIFFLILLIFGVGLILSVANTYFTDVGYLYDVFALILMYASALFYPIEIVPATIQKIFTLNPIYCAISCFRECVVFGVFPNLSALSYLAVFSLTFFFAGIILFSIYENKLTLEL